MKATMMQWVPVAAVLVAACGGTPEADRRGAGAGGPVVRDSAGIRIVENRGGDVALGAAAVRLRELVPADGALTPVPWGVTADPRTGRIYAADWTGTRVAMFDAGGAYAGGFGRAGDGPGEFRRPSALALDAEGAVHVWDTGRGVVSRWSGSGELLDERRPGLEYWGPGFAVGEGRLVTVSVAGGGSALAMTQRLVARGAGGAETLHEVAVELAMMRLCVSMPAPRVFSPSVVWTSRGDTIYHRNGRGYRIDVQAGGGPVASFRRAVEPIRPTAGMAEAAVESGPGPYRGFVRRCGVTAAEVAAAVGHEDVVSPVLGIVAAPGGRLWVTRTSDGMTPEHIDILDPGGEYRGTLGAPGMPVAFPSDSTFVGLRVEPDGRISLWLYALRPAPGSP